MSSQTEFWSFLDKSKMASDPEAMKIFGSITQMLNEEQVQENGEVLTERAFRYRLEKTGYWQNDRYFIKKSKVRRSPRKNRKKLKNDL